MIETSTLEMIFAMREGKLVVLAAVLALQLAGPIYQLGCSRGLQKQPYG